MCYTIGRCARGTDRIYVCMRLEIGHTVCLNGFECIVFILSLHSHSCFLNLVRACQFVLGF